MTIRLRCQRKIERLAPATLRPSRALAPGWERTRAAARLAASIAAVGLAEPLIVTPMTGRPQEYRVLDGHRRLALLVAQGAEGVDCLVERHPVPFAYNAYVQSLTAQGVPQEVQVALDQGATADQIDAALLVATAHVARRRELLALVTPEARARIGRRALSERALEYLSRVRGERQVELVTTMMTTHHLTDARTQVLYAATAAADLVDPEVPKSAPPLSADDIARIERQLQPLERAAAALERQQGRTVLQLVVAIAYFRELLKNPRVAAYLSETHPECHAAIWRIVTTTTLDPPPAAGG